MPWRSPQLFESLRHWLPFDAFIRNDRFGGEELQLQVRSGVFVALFLVKSVVDEGSAMLPVFAPLHVACGWWR